MKFRKQNTPKPCYYRVINENVILFIMEKGKSAKTSAPKGRPSGTGRESAGLQDTSAANVKTDKDLDDTYMDETGNPAANVHVRHENRNVDKGRDQQGKEDKEL